MTTAIGSSNSLTSDSLMNYCDSQLSSIDGEIDTTMESDNDATQVSQQLQSVIETFQQNSTGVNYDQNTCTALETALGKVVSQMQATDPNNPNLGPLTQTYNNMVLSGTGGNAGDGPQFINSAGYPPVADGAPGDNNISSDEMSSYINTLQGASSSLDSGSEMNLVEIQSLMSQRETAIQLTTNLVQSLGNQTNSIVSNIGH
jgi:hypothetical protein